MRNTDMLVPCPLCFNRLKTAEHELKGKGTHRFDVELDGRVPNVWDLANFFASPEMLHKVREKVVKQLENLKVVAYYGCMANRPPEVTGATDHENPQAIDRILTTLGATVIQWPYKTDCCGASLMISRPDMGHKMVGKLYDMARRMGAQAMVVSCQMCQSNLDMYQGQVESAWGRELALPIFYFTELMGLAWGLPDVEGWLSRHFADPRPVLREAGLLT
jgi:heterodisulfide reductase subunit B